MRFEVKTVKPAEFATDVAVVAVFADGGLGAAARALDKASRGLISAAIDGGDIKAEAGNTLLLPTANLPARRILVVGCGKRDDFDRKAFGKAISAAMTALKDKPYAQIAVYLTLETVRRASGQQLGTITASTWHYVNYSFTRMKSKPGTQPKPPKRIVIGARGNAAAAVRKGAKQGDALGIGMGFSRDLANLPGNVCTPSYLAKEARGLARKNSRLSCKVLSEAEMKKLGMGSLLSVTAGSVEPAKFIVLEYRGAAASAAPLVLIGKGITFDTGGISLKPPATMDEMKFDMSGAASVLGTVRAIAELNPKLNLVALVPTCENMPGGSATKPGDIVTSMSGQTIEILNTDAEGRLILCDALTYAKRFNPAAVIDVATLTGACVIALGKHYSGLLSNSDKLATKLHAAGEAAGDGAWRLPLGPEYSEQLNSNFADFANIGGREAGTITAACFLEKFADGMDWAHLDIAGTAYLGGTAKGSTGRPVPLLLEYLLNHR
jgi:leucyl aminopeptidase